MRELQNKFSNTNVKVATICGRVYAMDREQRYDRVEKAYKLYTDGVGNPAKNFEEGLSKSYTNGKNDEFVEPIIIEKEGIIKDNDSVLFFNFRSDRAREITTAFTDEKFSKFKTKNFKNLLYSCMTEYSIL